jgi:hypothetical protein
MGCHPQTRSRGFREGWTGRRRWYKCRKCGENFQHDGFGLPKKARICIDCLRDPVNMAQFQSAFA